MADSTYSTLHYNITLPGGITGGGTVANIQGIDEGQM